MSPLFGARVIAENSRGRQIENPLPSVRQAQSNELLISVPLFAFPRDEDQIRLRFSPPASDESKREWVNFTIKNPLKVEAAQWIPETLPRTNDVGGELVVLKALSINPVVCQFEVPGPGWTVSHCSIQDPEGNTFNASSTAWNRYQPRDISRGFHCTLETNHAWCVEATFVRATNFAVGDLRIVRLSANAAAVALTNRAGKVSDCYFPGTEIHVVGKPNDGPPHWIITAATNLDDGRPLEFPADTQWSGVAGGSITKLWPPLERQHTNILVQMADPLTITAKWYVDPARAPLTTDPYLMEIPPSLPPPLRRPTRGQAPEFQPGASEGQP